MWEILMVRFLEARAGIAIVSFFRFYAARIRDE